MREIKLQRYKKMLERAEVTFEQGLTPEEVQQIEETYQFTFPPDLREFLMYALPVSLIDWRHEKKEQILEILARPYEGICFDIERNDFWLDEWGPKPTSLAEACQIAKTAVDHAPKLIPVYKHRYIPEGPHEHGNPIFSVYQTDVIYYGRDLFDYLENEFHPHFLKRETTCLDKFKKIEFWSSLVSI